MYININNRMIGCRIKEARTAKGLKQIDLAKKLGINPVTVSNYETGSAVPPISRIQALSEILEKPPGWFLGERESLLKAEEVPLAEKLYELEPGALTDLTKPYTAAEAVQNRIDRLELERDIENFKILYSKLNKMGKQEALKRMAELSMLPMYQKNPEEQEGKTDG